MTCSDAEGRNFASGPGTGIHVNENFSEADRRSIDDNENSGEADGSSMKTGPNGSLKLRRLRDLERPYYNPDIPAEAYDERFGYTITIV
jgi:hypothetical protein